MAVVAAVVTMGQEHLVHLKVTVDRVPGVQDTDMLPELGLRVLGLVDKVIQAGMGIMAHMHWAQYMLVVGVGVPANLDIIDRVGLSILQVQAIFLTTTVLLNVGMLVIGETLVEAMELPILFPARNNITQVVVAVVDILPMDIIIIMVGRVEEAIAMEMGRIVVQVEHTMVVLVVLVRIQIHLQVVLVIKALLSLDIKQGKNTWQR